ncbi:hypothetical protein RRG08_053385 [Elysia crispata]|uniref:Cytochrome P450 n=1 Tax=Elysia crispata TaxID=231223 RepID=A0AAE1DFK0_9GAST|nr:hypothetical protein RRG08_053385 [Elysia crispata]
MLSSLLGFDLPPLLLPALVLVVTLLLKSWAEAPVNLPPFPGWRVPVVGHMLLLGANVREKLLEIRKTTGNIFSLYFGGTLVVVLSGFDVLKEAMIKQGDVFVDRPVGGVHSILRVNSGIIGSSGSTWKENRSAAFQILRSFGLGKDAMSQKVLEEIKLYLEYLENLGGQAANVKDTTTCATSNVICSIVLGKRFDYDDAEFISLLRSHREYITLISGAYVHAWFPQVKYLPGDFFKSKRLIQVYDEITSQMSHFIEKISEEERNGLATSNFISSYIEKMEEKEKSGQPTELSNHHLKRILFDLLVGGTDTTASTLLWFYLYMVHFPEVQEKIYEEIVREIGTARSPSGQDKVGLPYTKAVLLETQRFASILPLAISHRCNRETTVAGYTIPKDVPVLLHLDSVMLDDKIWDNAKTFRPERFLKGGKLACPEFFVAFGLGKRSCPGESLAKIELFLVSISVIQRFKVVPADPNNIPPLRYEKGATCAPLPFSVKFVARTAA